MTCALNKLNPLDALKLACNDYPGGVEALAMRIGMVPGVLRNKLSHDVSTHHINYPDQVSNILDCLREAKVDHWDAPLQAFAYRHERASRFVLVSVWVLLAFFCLACWWCVIDVAHWLMVHVSR